MTSLKRVYRSTLSEQVARQIARLISEGKYKTGERLPPESKLREIFGVGRSTLWEAFRSLAFIGVVDIRHGAGTYVADGSKHRGEPYSALEPKALMNLNSLWEARVILEPELAAFFASRAVDKEMRDLELLLAKMKQCPESHTSRFAELDLDFHLAIATGSKNPVLEGVLRSVRGPLGELMRGGVRGPASGGIQRVYVQHLKIVEALRTRDPQKARNEMQNHLQTFYRGYKVLLSTSASKSKARAERKQEILSS